MVQEKTSLSEEFYEKKLLNVSDSGVFNVE
jgi:hypothetical protein